MFSIHRIAMMLTCLASALISEEPRAVDQLGVVQSHLRALRSMGPRRYDYEFIKYQADDSQRKYRTSTLLTDGGDGFILFHNSVPSIPNAAEASGSAKKLRVESKIFAKDKNGYYYWESNLPHVLFYPLTNGNKPIVPQEPIDRVLKRKTGYFELMAIGKFEEGGNEAQLLNPVLEGADYIGLIDRYSRSSTFSRYPKWPDIFDDGLIEYTSKNLLKVESIKGDRCVISTGNPLAEKSIRQNAPLIFTYSFDRVADRMGNAVWRPAEIVRSAAWDPANSFRMAGGEPFKDDGVRNIIRFSYSNPDIIALPTAISYALILDDKESKRTQVVMSETKAIDGKTFSSAIADITLLGKGLYDVVGKVLIEQE